MKKYLYVVAILLMIIISSGCSKENNFQEVNKNDENKQEPSLSGLVIYETEEYTYLALENQSIYILKKINANINDYVSIIYDGVLDTTKDYQAIEVKSALKRNDKFLLTGFTSENNEKAQDIVDEMTLEEVVGSLFMPHHTSSSLEDIGKYHLGGLVLFGAAFKNKTKEEVIKMTSDLQEQASIPLLLAVDEEGGSVVRISSNKNLRNTAFASPRTLYNQGGFDLIEKDNQGKNELLVSLGLNVNLAPVLDISNDKNDYIYYRSIGLSPELTGEFAQRIINSSKNSGVVNVMKHYPGYGTNKDTHKTSSLDTRTLEEVENDLIPFKMAIDSGASAIMVSHNTVEVFDNTNPASISISNHNYLRNSLNFEGMVITDALNMGATASIEDIGLKAILAGNNILITKNYVRDIEKIISYVNDGKLSEEYLRSLAKKMIAWKIEMGLIK